MIDINKDYTGKILRMNYIYNGQEYSKVGIVYQQEKSGNGLRFTMLLPNGQEWKQPFTSENITKISAVRIGEELRTALKDLCKAKLEQKAFLERFWSQKSVYERNVSDALSAVQEASGQLTCNEMMDALERLFQEKFLAGDSYREGSHFWCTSISEKSAEMSHVQEVCKWASPERFPFLYREYDDNIFVNDKHPGHDEFCKKYAPGILPQLKGFVATSTRATVGDKNFLMAERIYEIPLKHGLTKQSLRDLEDMLNPRGLDEQLKSAKSRVRDASAQAPSKDKER